MTSKQTQNNKTTEIPLTKRQLTEKLLNLGDAFCVVNWLAQLAIQKQSLNSLKAYRRDLTQFLHFLNTQNLNDSEHNKDTLNIDFQQILTIQQGNINAFVSQRLEIDCLSVTSVQREVSSIRQYYGWLTKQQQLSHNPFKTFTLKNPARKLPDMVDIDTINALLDQPSPDETDTRQTMLWIRDKAMLEMLYTAGMRVSELTSLDVTDIDYRQGVMRVTGKGNKERILPIGKQAKIAINAWLAERNRWIACEPRLDKPQALFISQRLTRLSARTVERRITHHAKRANIDQRMYPHLLRHCFASHLLSGSGDLRAVQELLGHANIATTQIYTHLDFEKLSQVYDNSHPRSKRNKK